MSQGEISMSSNDLPPVTLTVGLSNVHTSILSVIAPLNLLLNYLLGEQLSCGFSDFPD